MRICLSLFTLALSQTAPAVNELPSPFEVAKNDKNLSSLKLVYDLTEMKFKIDQSRDVTVFMPINSALEAYPITKLTYPKIIDILNYHNLGRVVKLEELAPGDHEFETIEGSLIKVTVDQQKTVTINHDAKLVKPAIETPMGIAYIIDKVLVPPNVDGVSTTAAPKSTVDLAKDVAEYSNSISAPDHVRAVNEEQKKRNDVSGLVAAAADNVDAPNVANAEAPAAEVGVINGQKRRASKVNSSETQKKTKENKPARARSMASEGNTVRVGKPREGNHHSGGPDLAFRERGKLY